MPHNLIAFPTHDWRRCLSGADGLRHVALCDRMIQDGDISRFLWVRRVHPKRLLTGAPRREGFVRRPIFPFAGGVLYRIERYRGVSLPGRYLLEHHLPHAADSMLGLALNGLLASLGFSLPTLWIGDPKETWAFRSFSAGRRVFDAMDDWSLAPEFHCRRVAICDGYRLAQRADVVTCNTEQAGRRFHAHPDLRILPNAAGDVPAPAFAPKRAGRRRLGLVGHYSRGRLEPELLRQTLATRPDCDIIHIGSWLQGADVLRRDLAHPRFLSLGAVDLARSHAHMQRLDALLVPHPVCAYTRTQDRLTVYDALAMGLPVVSTEVPPADRLRSLCYVAKDAGQWRDCLKAALSEPAERREIRRAAMRNETWQNRWMTLKETLCT